MNEEEYAISHMQDLKFGSNPTYALSIIARYMYFNEHLTKEEIQSELRSMLIKSQPLMATNKWDGTLYAIADRCDKKQPVVIKGGIPITDAEICVCESMDTELESKLLFTLIALAKYNNLKFKTDKSNVYDSRSAINKYANITSCMSVVNKAYYKMVQLGFLSPASKIDREIIHVNCLDSCTPDPDSVIYRVDDMRNIGNQYMLFHSGDFMKCSLCGIITPKNSNRQQYCSDCAHEMIQLRNRFSSFQKENN